MFVFTILQVIITELSLFRPDTDGNVKLRNGIEAKNGRD